MVSFRGHQGWVPPTVQPGKGSFLKDDHQSLRWSVVVGHESLASNRVECLLAIHREPGWK